MLTFYARGKELPDERKLYKYRLIRIDPSKIIYWLGYSFGRYIPRTEAKAPGHSLNLSKDESGLEISAKLLESADDDAPAEPVQMDHDWMTRLEASVREGILSDEERKMFGSYKDGLKSHPPADVPSRVTEEERKILKKSKY